MKLLVCVCLGVLVGSLIIEIILTILEKRNEIVDSSSEVNDFENYTDSDNSSSTGLLFSTVTSQKVMSNLSNNSPSDSVSSVSVKELSKSDALDIDEEII